jgi:DNA-binding transcriptional MocR family regulator
VKLSDALNNVPIHLQRDSHQPLYTQIVAALSQAIDSGVLAPGARLPSIRALARRLEVNVVTVVTAYKELELGGYIWSRVGSGTFVRTAPPAETTRQIYIPHHGINFASATPTPEIFPADDFKRLLNQVLDRDGGHAFGYQESQGWPPLRESMAQYLAKNGIRSSVENIHIISGAQQGIDLAAKILVNQNDTIFVEEPTYHGAIASFQSRGARIIPIPLENNGPNLKILRHQLRRHRPKLFYAMPNFQNPTGYSYSRQKKQALLDLAREHQFAVVEDDYLSELSFQGPPAPRTLKAMDKEDQVVYIKSFSKILMPGLRLGLLVAPAHLNQSLGAAKQFSDISSSGLLQRTLDLYLREEAWLAHLEKLRRIYSARYQRAEAELRRHLPQLRFTAPGGGLHIWLQLPQGMNGDELYRHCLREEVLITPGSYFSPGGSYRQYFRLSYAAVTQEEISRGIEIMGKILAQTGAPPTIQPLL